MPGRQLCDSRAYGRLYHAGLVSVFIHAPREWRAQNLIERGEARNLQEALVKIKKADNDREGYYNYFTGRNWGVADNYHLTVDASLLPHEEMIDLIASFIGKHRKKDTAGKSPPTRSMMGLMS